MLIPPEKRTTAEKLAPRGTKGRLLAVLGNQTYLVWLGQRKVVQTSFIKLYEDATAHLQGPMGPTNALPSLLDTEEATELPDPPILPPQPQLRPVTVEIPLPQASKAQREEYQTVDLEAMDTSDLVCYLATKSAEECYKASKAKAPKGSEPTTFKQAQKHAEKDR